MLVNQKGKPCRTPGLAAKAPSYGRNVKRTFQRELALGAKSIKTDRVRRLHPFG